MDRFVISGSLDPGCSGKSNRVITTSYRLDGALGTLAYIVLHGARRGLNPTVEVSMFGSSLVRFAPALVCAAALVVGCAGDDDVGSNSENVTDTFSRPTEHGVLTFGVANAAEFSDEQRFHSWTFTLTGEAEVELLTELRTQNLDSVMYLYKKKNDKWGSYIEKNDDNDGAPESRIAKTLSEGEYRIKVKATKEFQRGDFAVTGTCNGDGCPVSDVGSCEGPTALPTPTGFTAACAAPLYEIITTPESAADMVCVAALEERAVQHYKDYWDEIIGYDELAGEEGAEPDVNVFYHNGKGTIVGVGLGGDEDSMDFVFDGRGELVFYYQHNQSPDSAWFCPEGAEVEEPDEDCVMSVLYNHEYDLSDTTQSSGTATLGENDDLSLHVAGALDAYAVAEGLTLGASVTYDATEWSASYTQGASVRMSAEGTTEATYVVLGDADYGMTVALRNDDSGTTFVCTEL